MSYPTSVTIEITKDRYTSTVKAGDEIVSTRTMEMQGRGSSEATETGEILDDIPEYEELADDIDNAMSDAFCIACSLFSIHEIES